MSLFDIPRDYRPALPLVRGGNDLTKPDTLSNRLQILGRDHRGRAHDLSLIDRNALDGHESRMPIRDLLVPELVERFSDRGLQLGTPPTPSHRSRQSIPMWVTPGCGTRASARVAVGEIVGERFHLWPSDDVKAGTERIGKSVVRFLQELFADRLLFWQAVDSRKAGWRERGDVGYSEPLVLDDRTYRTYLWSGPVSLWQATPAIFARGRIQDDREYQIMFVRLNDAGPDGFQGTERDIAGQLVAEYERRSAV